MKKRLFAIMLALAMVLVAVPALAEEGDGREAPESTKKICLNCKAKDKVNEEGLCEKCVSNLKQDNTQQKMITSLKTLNEDNTEGGANGGGTGDNNGDNTGGDPGNNAGNTDNNGGNTSGEAGDNNGESNNPDSTDSSGSTGGDTGTDGGQNPLTNGGGEGGEQPANPQQPCTHNNVEYTQNTDDPYRKHKKVCKDCKADLGDEPHQWDETTKKPKTEGTDKIPTCTSGGHWTMECKFCHHVTVFDGPALGHNYEYHWGTWDCKTKTITAYRKCKRADCTVMENHPAISFSEKGRDTWYSCGKKYTTVSYQVTAEYSDATVEYEGKAECTYSTSDYCRPDWYYDPCYYNNPCGHWGCGNVCTRYSDCVPCQNYRTTFRVGGYNCLATPKTGDVSVMAPAMLALIGAAGAMLGKKRR